MNPPFVLHPDEYILTSRAPEMRNKYSQFRWLVFEEMLDMVEQDGFRIVYQREDIFRPEMLPVYVVRLAFRYAP